MPGDAALERAFILTTRAILAVLCLAALAAGCAASKSHTGFVEQRIDAQPARGAYEGKPPPIRIADPDGKTVIVYSHGTTDTDKVEDCSRWWNRVPGSLLAQQSEHVLIYYLCSAEREPDAGAQPKGTYIYRRLDELKQTLQELKAAGVPMRKIFLAGHSAGGWASLMAFSRLAGQFNGAIAFAPAFAGRRDDANQNARWRKEARPRQIEEMTQAPAHASLVFAHRCDPYERPEDLAFLAQPRPDWSVQLLERGCLLPNPHMIHIWDCQEAESIAAIASFIRQRSEP